MLVRSSRLIEYFSSLLKYLNNLVVSNENQATFRIDSIKKVSDYFYMVNVQIIGKSTVFECELTNIIKNYDFLEGFSKKDIYNLILLSTGHPQSHYEIIMENFKGTKETLFKLQNIYTKEILEKTAFQIYSEKSILNQLSEKDAFKVGYVAASDRILK